jgi:hypothetical protein
VKTKHFETKKKKKKKKEKKREKEKKNPVRYPPVCFVLAV